MVYKYKPVQSKNRRRAYTPEDLRNALKAIEDGMSLRNAMIRFKVPRNTLHRYMKLNTNKESPSFLNMGHPTALLLHEERVLAQNFASMADWGCPLSHMDIKMVVKDYLTRSGRDVPCFKNNVPGKDWVNSFIKRYSHILSKRMCQNISRKRAEISSESVNKFFDNITPLLEGVPPSNIINYDETNFSNDPGASKLVFRRGIKYPERVLNVTKTSYSVMFAGSAAGDILPPYVVYKGQRLEARWTEGGPHMCRYNVSKSGWFDSSTFLDWFKCQLVPFCRNLEGKKVVIGDNLPAHLNEEVFELCNSHNITFTFLPPNTTHLMQPLDVAFFGPMKSKWRAVLLDWKKGLGKNLQTLPKDWFPRLLGSLIAELNPSTERNMKSAFAATGLYPLDRQRVLKKLDKEAPTTSTDVIGQATSLVAQALLVKLKEVRSPPEPPPGSVIVKRRKRIHLTPGKSHTEVKINEATATSKPALTKTKRALSFNEPSESESESDSSEENPTASHSKTVEELPLPAASVECESLSINDFILIKFEIPNQAAKFYVARVEEPLNDDEFVVECLRKTSDSKNITFHYPPQSDISSIYASSIQRKLTLKCERRGKLEFSQRDNRLLMKLSNLG